MTDDKIKIRIPKPNFNKILNRINTSMIGLAVVVVGSVMVYLFLEPIVGSVLSAFNLGSFAVYAPIIVIFLMLVWAIRAVMRNNIDDF